MNDEPNSYIVNEAMTHLGLPFEMFEEGTCKASIIAPTYDYVRGIIYIICLVWDDEDDREMTATVMLTVAVMGGETKTIHMSPTGR